MTFNKIAWTEGILLGQQHFQQWEHYLESQARERVFAFNTHSWGVISLSIDENALQHGRIKLLNCKAIMPNGQFIHLDRETISYDLQQENASTIPIYISIPDNNLIKDINGYPQPTIPSAWRVHYQDTLDDYDQERQSEVIYAKPNIHLVSSVESEQACNYLQIAEVTHISDNQYELVKNYIPPTLNINTIPLIIEEVNLLLQLIQQKLNELINLKFVDTIDYQLIQYRALSHALLTAYNALKQHHAHPKPLYTVCTNLFAAVLVWHSQSSSFEMPQYHHDNLSNTFNPLFEKLKYLLSEISASRTPHLEFTQEDERLYSMKSIPSSSISDSHFYLLVDYHDNDTNWIGEFAQYVKCGSNSAILNIVTSALPGVTIRYESRPPEKLQIKPGQACFHLVPAGAFWQQVISDKSLAIFLADPFKEAKIELKML